MSDLQERLLKFRDEFQPIVDQAAQVLSKNQIAIPSETEVGGDLALKEILAGVSLGDSEKRKVVTSDGSKLLYHAPHCTHSLDALFNHFKAELTRAGEKSLERHGSEHPDVIEAATAVKGIMIMQNAQERMLPLVAEAIVEENNRERAQEEQRIREEAERVERTKSTFANMVTKAGFGRS